MLSIKRLRERLSYNPRTGEFHWLHRPDGPSEWNTRYAGTVAGVSGSKGYIYICIDYKKYAAHRLAWMFVHGAMPNADIDHVDRDKANNRIANLRLATKRQNRWNEAPRVNNTSGAVGVYWNKCVRKWQAYITVDGKPKYLGIFKDKSAAIAARDAAATELRGEYAFLNAEAA